MTVTSKVLVQGKRIEDTATTQYTSIGCKTIIDTAPVLNTSGAPVALSAWLVPSGGAASDANKIAELSIGADVPYLFPELVGRRLDAGDFLVLQAGAGDSLSFRMDGRQVTA